ncbi:phosphodiester glycosidase family protein, partial [Bacillus thuringiensis]|nr:phosphodiester glycosidase family protein [Bacillus thuringiensis]
RYLPNAWVVTANPKQKINMTIDGEKVNSETFDKFDTNIISN